MLGAIVGDIIGSPYEFKGSKELDFPLLTGVSRFTDDTVLTCATAEVLLHGGDYADAYRRWSRKYPDRSYGMRFRRWFTAEAPAGLLGLILPDRTQPYGSYGNGAAMRVSPIGWLCDTWDKVIAEAKRSAAVTHNHPEGIRGAQVAAAAVFLARTGAGKEDIRREITRVFGYHLSRSVAEIRPAYVYAESCQQTVPEAICCFLDSTDYVSAVRNAVSLGGDADTLACIAGSLAHAHYRFIPPELTDAARALLADEMRSLLRAFERGTGLGWYA